VLRRTSAIDYSGAPVGTPTNALQSRFPPLLYALAAHLGGLLVVFLIAVLVGAVAEVSVPLYFSVVLEGVVAAFLSYRMGLPIWWIPTQLLFFPAVLVMLALEISANWFLGLFVLSVSVYWSVFRTQVPLYLSSAQAWAAVAALLPERDGLRVIDLGSGLGGLLKYLAGVYANAEFVGVEAAPLPFFWGWLRVPREHCRMLLGSLWDVDLNGFDVAYAYLSPVPMSRLWEKVRGEMRPGSLFISNSFAVPGVVPSETVQLDDFHRSTLFIYRL
jgi:hypothetical protein